MATKALDNVSIEIESGETLGLVGESGCGKTTLGKALLGLIKDVSGSVHYANHSVFDLTRRELRLLRQRMQMIFQNPYAALNKHMKVRDILLEAVRLSEDSKCEVDRVEELSKDVNLGPDKLAQYPWELSGGERRRVGIARILAVNPEFIVADEPVAALDLSIKAQVLNLLARLKEERKLTYLFISHDLSVVKHISDRIAVMYMGKVVEVLAADDLTARECRHPYTQELLSASVVMSAQDENRKTDFIGVDWEVPKERPSGCRFHTRCYRYEQKERPEICRDQDPELVAHSNTNGTHRVACHFSGEGTAL